MNDLRSDTEIIQDSFDDPQAFGMVFERHWDPVFGFFERRFGHGLAADLAADVFRIAFERRSSYAASEDSSCLPWLYGIAANLAMKERRRFARYMAALNRLKSFEADSYDDLASDVATSIDAEVEWASLRDALVALDPTSREMLLLVAWEGLSYEHAAVAFSIPVGTVRSRIHRSRDRLRVLLGVGTSKPIVDQLRGVIDD